MRTSGGYLCEFRGKPEISSGKKKKKLFLFSLWLKRRLANFPQNFRLQYFSFFLYWLIFFFFVLIQRQHRDKANEGGRSSRWGVRGWNRQKKEEHWNVRRNSDSPENGFWYEFQTCSVDEKHAEINFQWIQNFKKNL